MSAPSFDLIRFGGERARAGRWRGDRRVALLSPVADAPVLSADFLRRCLDTLAGQGYTRVLTSALSPLEQCGFLAAGFDVEERLHLLGIDLDDLPPAPRGATVRRPGPHRRHDALRVDAAAFEEFWRLDARGLRDALAATPSTRFRVALGSSGAVAGYAISGRSAGRGYVQRLAVDPALQRRGTGRRLLLDGLHWMRRRGVGHAVVNTQVGNDAALRLYLGVGFEEEPVGLSVLSAALL